MATDYTILAKPRISLERFAKVLRDAKSPAAGPAAACYAAAVREGVDPAVLLAVFEHESSFGTRGLAVVNKSFGNLRHAGRFVRYATWPKGAADCARLLAIYGRNEIRPGTRTDTTQTFPFVWAPRADHNDPDAYGDAITRAIAAWIRAGGVVTPTKPAGAAGRLEGTDLQLFAVSRGVARETTDHATVRAWVGGARHYRPNATLRRVLTGGHRLAYVQASAGTLSSK